MATLTPGTADETVAKGKTWLVVLIGAVVGGAITLLQHGGAELWAAFGMAVGGAAAFAMVRLSR